MLSIENLMDDLKPVLPEEYSLKIEINHQYLNFCLRRTVNILMQMFKKLIFNGTFLRKCLFSDLARDESNQTPC